MANNPVQIVLNDDVFLKSPDPKTFGPGKDFYEGRDKEFVAHQSSLISSIRNIHDRVSKWDYGAAAILKVQMKTEALAKSYRPVNAIFLSPSCECVGADGIGTLYFLVSVDRFAGLVRRILKAEREVVTRISKNTGEPYKAPSRERSEVGAIESIMIAPADRKRDFDVSSALEMLNDPATISGYQVELFSVPDKKTIEPDLSGLRALQDSFEDLLTSAAPGTVTLLAPSSGRTPILEFQLIASEDDPTIENREGLKSPFQRDTSKQLTLDLNPSRHEVFLETLANHPLVRSIQPPVRIALNSTPASQTGNQNIAPSEPSPNMPYPTIGVIDSGVSSILTNWIVDRFDFLSDDEFDCVHGTQVAGLLTMGQQINGSTISPEPDGCKIYDIPLFPKIPAVRFLDAYPAGFTGFLEEVEQAIEEAVENEGVRIFNLSINVISPVERHRYSTYAARLDMMADQFDVIFVNSCGNLAMQEARQKWQSKPKDVISYFAARTASDTIMKPAESVRTISVGALNPPGTSHLQDAPSVYSRRGPGLDVGIKPDVCAYGGSGTLGADPSGLQSINADGEIIDVRGTSFAAPLVARTLAELDHLTQSALSTDALRGLLIHSTNEPYPLTRRGMKDLSRQFGGFGKPGSAESMLVTGNHQITMVFESRLLMQNGKPTILRFPFQWPSALVNPASGECSGRVRMTLVSRPPLDPAFGAEFVRINLDASLKQRQSKNLKDGSPSFRDQVSASLMPNSAGAAVSEQALIKHGLKWWPLKQYKQNLNNRGESSEWRLEVTSITRAEASFPNEGVPFAVILTIEDPEGIQPIYQQMQQYLQASAAQTVGIQSVTRIRPRSGSN